MEQDLTLREALAADRLDDFVRQEEAMGVELVNGSELERALALLVTRHHRVSALSGRRIKLDKVAQNIPSEPHPDPVYDEQRD
jgi:hypothetical protein